MGKKVIPFVVWVTTSNFALYFVLLYCDCLFSFHLTASSYLNVNNCLNTMD